MILPAWLEPPNDYADRLVIRMDPGSAFGTGSHPTTRLCLEALEQAPPEGALVADLGCGSGVLGLAALGLGAEAVVAAGHRFPGGAGDGRQPGVEQTVSAAAPGGVGVSRDVARAACPVAEPISCSATSSPR